VRPRDERQAQLDAGIRAPIQPGTAPARRADLRRLHAHRPAGPTRAASRDPRRKAAGAGAGGGRAGTPWPRGPKHMRLLRPARVPRAARTEARLAATMPVLGLRANLGQFLLLVLINAFVGAMVGLERSTVPLLGERVFGLASTTTALSFIVSFGLVKALANLFAGRLSDRLGRKGVLVVGWLVGLPVPLLIIWARSWGWVVFANVLLGINQGLCWSTTVIMKIDLVGPRRRGLAMGFNEAAGYGAVALAAIAAGYLAATYALRPQPFLLGVGFALAG